MIINKNDKLFKKFVKKIFNQKLYKYESINNNQRIICTQLHITPFTYVFF